MPISDDGRSLGPAEGLTSGTTLEASPLLTPAGTLIFASLNLVQSVWSLPLDLGRAKITGEPKQITAGPAESQPSISLDGRKLAFLANQNARPNSVVTSSEEPSTFQVHVKDLATGKEAPISDAERVQFHPQISRDRTLLAYSTRTGIQIFRIDNWPPRTISGMQNGGKASDWSTDNKRLLIGTYPQANIYVYDAASGRESLLLSKPGYGLFQAKFAPDSRAVAFIGCDSQRPGIDCRVFVVPLKSDGAPDADNWIAIDHSSRWDDKPRWSPDGSLIYFVSDRDGQFCLWAQRLDTRTKRPVGTPFAAYHFHDSRLAMNNVGTGELEIDVARDKVVMGLGELTGNIWSLKR